MYYLYWREDGVGVILGKIEGKEVKQGWYVRGLDRYV